MASFADLQGKTLARISGLSPGSEKVDFFTTDGHHYCQSHSQDCCESVEVQDMVGDLADVIGWPILLAEEVQHSNENPPEVPVPEYEDSWTWTFYKLSTIKGSVTIRWYGSSNGYYSETVDFEEVSA